MNPKSKKIIIIIVVLLLVVVGGVAYYFFRQVEDANVNTTSQNTNINAPVNSTVALNTNTETNTNVQPIGSMNTNEPITVRGVVFIKGYKTPSESFGILTTDGFEIGFGKYDSMKETFRPYVGESVEVSFERVCRTSDPNCCRTLFIFCGEVDSYTSLEE